VPRIEYAQQILGSIFVSSVFPERAPEGHVMLSTLVGGTRHPSLGAADLDTLRPVVLGDLRALLGIRGEPVMERHVHWARAIPQYELGYEHVTAQLDRLERDLPGLVFAGNFRSGASVGDTMQSAATAAGRVAKAA
jgi:oxygen-dependent protoporphyrinogen oxidase